MSSKTKLFILLAFSFPLILGLACGISQKTPDPTATLPPVIAQPTEEIVTEEPGEPVLESPTEPAVVEPPSQASEGLVMLDNSIFIQDGTSLVSVFMLQNTDSQITLKDVEVIVDAYNASGAKVETVTEYLSYIFPGQILGIVSDIWLDEGVTVESVNADWIIRSSEPASSLVNPFTIEKTKYFNDGDWQYLTGVIKNTQTLTYTDLRVNAVAFDASGQVIGGGYTYVDFIPGNDQVGARVFATLTGEPARIEIYPILSSWSATFEDGDWWNNIQVNDFGFVQDGDEIGGGFLIKNITDQILKDSQYYVTVYEVDGTVAEVDSGFIDLLWPDETLGFSPNKIHLPDAANPDYVDVIIMPGEFSEHALASNPLTTNNIAFVPDVFWPTVKVTVVNTLNKSITDIKLFVLLFDANDEIIGGGSAYPDDLSANGSQEVEVWVTYIDEGEPARIEAYPTITTWSEIGD